MKNINEKAVKAQWVSMMRFMISEFRLSNPADGRDDRQIATSIMNFYAKSGLIRKDRTGRFILPEILLDS